MEGLLSYHAKHGSILDQATFVIPSSNDNDDDDNVWPVATQGLPLGSIVQRIRLRRDFLSSDDGDDRLANLDKLGFDWDVGGYNFDKFVRALHYYDQLSSGMKSGHDIRSQQQHDNENDVSIIIAYECQPNLLYPPALFWMADRFMGLSSRRTYPAL